MKIETGNWKEIGKRTLKNGYCKMEIENRNLKRKIGKWQLENRNLKFEI